MHSFFKYILILCVYVESSKGFRVHLYLTIYFGVEVQVGNTAVPIKLYSIDALKKNFLSNDRAVTIIL